MRRLIAIAVTALAAHLGIAAEPTETITVTGSATVYVKPDAARVHYSVRVSDASADAAKDTASKQVATITESIKGLKLDNLKTTTGTITYSRSSFARAMRGGGGFAPGAAGGPGGGGPGGPAGLGPYSAYIPLTATIVEKDSDKLRGVVDAFTVKIVEAGATMAGDAIDDGPFGPGSARSALAADSPRIDWYLSDDSTARREALRIAVRKAKADAETLAKELGWEKLNILSVADGPSSPRDVGELATPVVRAPAGEVAISVRVTVKCSR